MLKNAIQKKDISFPFFHLIAALVLIFCMMPYGYSETSDTIKKFYCPSKIICSKNNDISSCHHTAEGSPYWDRVGYVSSPNRVFSGEYNFLVMFAPYHASFVAVSDRTQDNMIVCHYINKEGQDTLGVIAKPAPNLEAYKDDTTKWSVNYKGTERSACFSNSTQDCPLKEAYSLAIFNHFDSAMIISIHDTRLPIYFSQGDSGYYTIRYEDVLPYCSSENLCKIDFSTLSEANIGSIVIDMNNAMRIVKIVSTESSTANLMQNVPFNSIRIEKVDIPPDQVASIDINNQTGTNLLASVNEKTIITISAGKTETIRLNRMLSVCNDLTKCIIDIGVNSTRPNVGTITVSMQDKMKIIETTSFRPSQLSVKKVDSSNLIEIKYPNFR